MPPDEIDTAHGHLSMVDGVIVERVHAIKSTPGLIDEEFAAISALAGGERRSLLFDIREWKGGEVSAWKDALGRLRSAILAIAFLTDDADTGVLGPWPPIIDQLLIPARVFTDESEAMAFLAFERDRDAP